MDLLKKQVVKSKPEAALRGIGLSIPERGELSQEEGILFEWDKSELVEDSITNAQDHRSRCCNQNLRPTITTAFPAALNRILHSLEISNRTRATPLTNPHLSELPARSGRGLHRPLPRRRRSQNDFRPPSPPRRDNALEFCSLPA
nr:hypothetical protein Iba_chr12eCG16010 [Ipomoea batatas]